MADLRPLYLAGAWGALAQLVSIVVLIGATAALGPRVETAEAFFAAYAAQGAAVALRGDLVILALMIAPYLATAPAVAAGLRDRAPYVGGIFVVASYAAVLGAMATESTFSLLHLAEQWVAATPGAERDLLVAAGQAVVATDLWNSTAGLFGGVLLQGSGVLVSVAMLRSPRFSRVTAGVGLLANGLDLLQHLVHPVVPDFAETVQAGMGIFYLGWFPLLARDLFRLSQPREG